VQAHALFGFYREMDVHSRRTFWTCFGGYAVDAMDFMSYPLLIGTLLTVLHIDRTTAGATVALFSSAIGGWAAGYLADRFGRVRTMQITIALLSLGSLLAAFKTPLSL
jgi:MFS family permease